MASPNYIIFPSFLFPKINHKGKKTLNHIRALPSNREENSEWKLKHRPGCMEVPHAFCSTYGTWDHPRLGDLSNRVRSGWRFTLNWEVGPDGAQQVGATGVNGREVRDSFWVCFLSVPVGSHKFPARQRATAHPARSSLQISVCS